MLVAVTTVAGPWSCELSGCQRCTLWFWEVESDPIREPDLHWDQVLSFSWGSGVIWIWAGLEWSCFWSGPVQVHISQRAAGQRKMETSLSGLVHPLCNHATHTKDKRIYLRQCISLRIRSKIFQFLQGYQSDGDTHPPVAVLLSQDHQHLALRETQLIMVVGLTVVQRLSPPTGWSPRLMDVIKRYQKRQC